MQPNYAPQRATHRRTESAILSTTKELIAERGLSAISMIEIAERSQVSRATLYNHYRDKEAVVSALLDSEVKRLIEIAQTGTPANCLERLALAISIIEIALRPRSAINALVVERIALSVRRCVARCGA